MSVRYRFIENQVLKIYRDLDQITFPIDTKKVIEHIPNCKYMSYQELARITNCSVNDIINLCESTSGATHYDMVNNRYLILCNQSTEHNNNYGRQRWTCSHEIGHVICRHHLFFAYEKLSQNNLFKTADPLYEIEADYFSAVLLAPFPLFDILNIHSTIDVQNVFGLSDEASYYRYKEYIKWHRNRYKTAWENDMIKVYKQKC